MLHPPAVIKARRILPARYEAGRLTRPPLSSAAPGETGVLDQRGDAVLRDGRDPGAGREADLGGVLDAAWSRALCAACATRSALRRRVRTARSRRVRALRTSRSSWLRAVLPRRSKRLMSLLTSRSAAARVPKRPTRSVATPDNTVARLEGRADVHERGALGDPAALGSGRLRGRRVGLGGVARTVLRGRASATTSGLAGRLGSGAASRRASGRALARGRLTSRRALRGSGLGGVCRRGFGHAISPFGLTLRKFLEVFVDESIHRTLVCNPLPQACYRAYLTL